MNQKSLNLHYGNKKGFILTLDIAVAAILVMTILMVATVYINRSTEDPMAKLNIVKTGYNIITILDYNQTLNQLNQTLLQTEMEKFLPVNYDMKIQLIGNFPSGLIETNNTVPEDKSIITGKRIFATNYSYGTVRFWIWQK